MRSTAGGSKTRGSAHVRAARARDTSSELRVDRGPDLVERFPLLVHPIGEPSFFLADLAVTGHAVALVARQQRVIAFHLRASAAAADPVNDLRDLPDHVEHGCGLRVFGAELLAREYLRRGDAAAWGGVVCPHRVHAERAVPRGGGRREDHCRNRKDELPARAHGCILPLGPEADKGPAYRVQDAYKSCARGARRESLV